MCRLLVSCLQALNHTTPALTPYKSPHVAGLPARCSTDLEQQPLEAPQFSLLLRLEVVQVGGVDQIQPQAQIPSIGEVALALQACKELGLSKLL